MVGFSELRVPTFWDDKLAELVGRQSFIPRTHVKIVKCGSVLVISSGEVETGEFLGLTGLSW